MSERPDDEAQTGAGDELMDLIEVYRCGAEMEANRVIDELLAPEGIEGFVHDRTSHSLPSPAEMGDFFIAVPTALGARARIVLAQARAAGELDAQSGSIIAG